MEKSIYSMICDSMTDGILKEGFSLTEEDPDTSELRYAPGAMDGIFMYHMGRDGMSDEAAEEMARCVNSAASGNEEEAERLFAVWTRENRAIAVIDDLQNYVRENAASLNAGNVYKTARHMITKSSDAECVKIGMEFMELFERVDEDTKEAIRRLGQFDEFTVFALWDMKKWENGNQEIFSLAKKVTGWGHIHALELLEPETEEIREWILLHGVSNDVLDAYSALTCYEKSGAAEVLSGTPAEEEYRALLVMFDALLDEGPVPGISRVENAEEMLLRLLELSDRYELDMREYSHILRIKDWAEEDGGFPAVADSCDRILKSPACADAVMKAAENGEGLELAEYLELPYRQELLACMYRDFDRFCVQCGRLMKDEAYVQSVLTLFRGHIPLDRVEGAPVEDVGFGPEYKYQNQLQYLLQELDGMPLTGKEFVKAGLKSPLTRNRHRALEVLKKWGRKEGKTLEELSPELYGTVKDMEKTEIYPANKEMIRMFLEGRV